MGYEFNFQRGEADLEDEIASIIAGARQRTPTEPQHVVDAVAEEFSGDSEVAVRRALAERAREAGWECPEGELDRLAGEIAAGRHPALSPPD